MFGDIVTFRCMTYCWWLRLGNRLRIVVDWFRYSLGFIYFRTDAGFRSSTVTVKTLLGLLGTEFDSFMKCILLVLLLLKPNISNCPCILTSRSISTFFLGRVWVFLRNRPPYHSQVRCCLIFAAGVLWCRGRGGRRLKSGWTLSTVTLLLELVRGRGLGQMLDICTEG